MIEERDIEHVLQLIGLATSSNLLFIPKSLSLWVTENLIISILKHILTYRLKDLRRDDTTSSNTRLFGKSPIYLKA